MTMEWQVVTGRAPWDGQPCRQWIRIEGSRFHSGLHWHREFCGEAYIRRPGADDEWLGYRRDDILRLCEQGDIDPDSAKVTHWMPVAFPPVTTGHRGDDNG